MRVDYQVARRLATRPEHFTRPAGLSRTLTTLRKRARGPGGLVQIKPHGRDKWSPRIAIPDAIERLEDRFKADKDNRDLDSWLLKSVRTGTVWVVREQGYPEDAVDLPPGAHLWPRPMQELFQYNYTPGQFKAGRPTYLGVYVRRQTRQGGSWSYHSWAQALDAGIARADGTFNNALALEIERKVMAEFRPVMRMVVTFQDNSLHANHDHEEIDPDRTGQTPPLSLAA